MLKGACQDILTGMNRQATDLLARGRGVYLFIYLFCANQKEHVVSDVVKEMRECKYEWIFVWVFNGKIIVIPKIETTK